VSSSKAPASRTTALDVELFAIKQKVSKATSMDIECIILITDSLDLAKRAVDLLVYSGQAHLPAVCSALRLFFRCGSHFVIQDFLLDLESPEISNYVLSKNIQGRSEQPLALAYVLHPYKLYGSHISDQELKT